MKNNGVYKFILLALLIHTTSILYINHFNYRNNSSNSQQEELTQKTLRTAAQFEYSELNGTLDDATSIQVELPDLTWNITDIQLNFTNISQHRQLRTIEGNTSSVLFKPLYYYSKFNWIDYYGQQINFSEPTEVFGIYLYGFKTFLAEEWVWVHFRGFDDDTHKPNSTTYASRELNISNVIRWYHQDFSSSSLIFNKDEYYIVIDGYWLISTDPIYYFACNTKNPTYPSLWEWERNRNGEFTYQGEPFMCKILQKANKTYFPKELEMQAIIDESEYDIINGTQSGEGILSLTLLNFKPESIYFDIPIVINDSSLTVIYNVSYHINLRKSVSVIIIEVGGGGNGDGSKVSTGIAPELFFIIISLIIISFIGALTSYQTVKRIKRKKKSYREKIFNKYMDVLNLDYIIVSDKLSGVSIYEQIITDKKLNPTLISGFLQAIRSFGLELTSSDEQSQTIKLEYQKSKILMSEFKNYRIINIFEDSPSKEFTEALDPLSRDIDKYYGKSLEKFDGDVTQFRGMKSLLEKYLQISLIYPLKIEIPEEIKLKKNEKSIVNRASDVMKKNKSNHFYVSYLMSEREFNPKKAETILNLINKNVFQPII